MSLRAASLASRLTYGALAFVLGLQVAAVGIARSSVPPREAQFADHAPAIDLLLPSTPISLELEDGEAGTDSMGSPSRVDDRPHPASNDACAEVFTAWRADDALARAGRLSSPSTAPPLSGA